MSVDPNGYPTHDIVVDVEAEDGAPAARVSSLAVSDFWRGGYTGEVASPVRRSRIQEQDDEDPSPASG